MDAIKAIITRRSTRKYSDKMPDRDVIERIIEAGRYAPSGHNNQYTHFTVITDKKIIGDIARIAEELFAKMEIGEDTYVSLAGSIRASKKGGYVFHYNAPVVVIVSNQKGYGNAMADSTCAMENMMIAANALDIGSCWLNQLHWLDGEKQLRDYLEGIGIGSDETVCASLALGYAATEDLLPSRDALRRTGNRVDWI